MPSADKTDASSCFVANPITGLSWKMYLPVNEIIEMLYFMLQYGKQRYESKYEIYYIQNNRDHNYHSKVKFGPDDIAPCGGHGDRDLKLK